MGQLVGLIPLSVRCSGVGERGGCWGRSASGLQRLKGKTSAWGAAGFSSRKTLFLQPSGAGEDSAERGRI